MGRGRRGLVSKAGRARNLGRISAFQPYGRDSDIETEPLPAQPPEGGRGRDGRPRRDVGGIPTGRRAMVVLLVRRRYWRWNDRRRDERRHQHLLSAGHKNTYR